MIEVNKNSLNIILGDSCIFDVCDVSHTQTYVYTHIFTQVQYVHTSVLTYGDGIL